jgi:CHASE2 domain-containing sensor protein
LYFTLLLLWLVVSVVLLWRWPRHGFWIRVAWALLDLTICLLSLVFSLHLRLEELAYKAHENLWKRSEARGAQK